MTRKRDTYYMDLAVAQALSAERVAGAKVGAVLVIKKRVISFGVNKRKTHPFQKAHAKNKDAIDLHAENDAIVNALRHFDVDELKRATLYVARVKKPTARSQFTWGLAKPCSGCQKAIAAMGIKRVFYTTDEEGVMETL